MYLQVVLQEIRLLYGTEYASLLVTQQLTSICLSVPPPTVLGHTWMRYSAHGPSVSQITLIKWSGQICVCLCVKCVHLYVVWSPDVSPHQWYLHRCYECYAMNTNNPYTNTP